MLLIIHDIKKADDGIDITKTDKLFKKVYKSSPKNRKLKKQYSKLTKPYRNVKKAPIADSGKQAAVSEPPLNPAIKVEWKQVKKPNGAIGKPFLQSRLNPQDKEANNGSKRVRRRRRIKLSESSDSSSEEKKAEKPRRNPIIIRRRAGDGKAFRDWKQDNEVYGFMLDGEGVIDHFRKLLESKKTLRKSDYSEFDATKASYVSSLSLESALALYTEFEEEQTFIFKSNPFLRSHVSDLPEGLDESVSRTRERFPNDASELSLYILRLNFEEESNEKIQAIFDFISKKIESGDDSESWELPKQFFANNLLLEQAEYLLELEKYGDELHAYLICHNEALAEHSFNEAIKMNWQELLECLEQWQEYPIMTDFVEKIKKYLANELPVEGLKEDEVKIILDRIDDPALQLAFSSRRALKENPGYILESISWAACLNRDAFTPEEKKYLACEKPLGEITSEQVCYVAAQLLSDSFNLRQVFIERLEDNWDALLEEHEEVLVLLCKNPRFVNENKERLSELRDKMSPSSLLLALRMVNKLGNTKYATGMFKNVFIKIEVEKLSFKDACKLNKYFNNLPSEELIPFRKAFLLNLSDDVFCEFLKSRILSLNTPVELLIDLIKKHKNVSKEILISFVNQMQFEKPEIEFTTVFKVIYEIN